MKPKDSSKRTTIYMNPKLHRALRVKAIQVNTSLSELINHAVQMSLKEDMIDLKAIDERRNEATSSFEDVIKELKKDGLL